MVQTTIKLKGDVNNVERFIKFFTELGIEITTVYGYVEVGSVGPFSGGGGSNTTTFIIVNADYAEFMQELKNKKQSWPTLYKQYEIL